MKKNQLTSIVFSILLAICCILSITAFFSQAEISDRENRRLQVFPELTSENYLNGSFFKNLESYVYDHFPQRDKILEMVAVYDKLKGIQPEIMALEKGNNMNLVNQPADSEPAKDHNPEMPTIIEEKPLPQQTPDYSEYKTQTQNLSIMAVKDTLMELYHFDEHIIAAYASALNQLAEKMPDHIRMYSLIAPTQIGLTDEQYRDFSDPQNKAIEYIYSQLHQRYQTIDAFTPLYQQKAEYLYFRSDHHWTQLGAYQAAVAFAETAKLDFPAIDQYEKHSFHNFLGYLYHNNQVDKVAQNPDRIDAYILPAKEDMVKHYIYQDDSSADVENISDKNDSDNKKDYEIISFLHPLINLNIDTKSVNYGIFLGGDFPMTVYENPVPGSNRNLMVIKDSYANAFVPWLTDSFDKIIVIDPRFFKENIYELAVKEEITDFMVLDYIMATGLEGFIDYLDKIARHPAVSVPTSEISFAAGGAVSHSPQTNAVTETNPDWLTGENTATEPKTDQPVGENIVFPESRPDRPIGENSVTEFKPNWLTGKNTITSESQSGQLPGEKPGEVKNPEDRAEAVKVSPDFSEFKTQWRGLFILPTEDSILELFHFNEKKVADYIKAVNQFAGKMPEQVRLYSLLVPTQVGLREEMYRDYSDPQGKAIGYIYSQLNSRYQGIKAFPVMYAHRQEYLFFRSDHHWTQLGAYYAAKAFAKQADFAIRPLSDYQLSSKKGFLGYLYGRKKTKAVAENPDNVELYTYTGEEPQIVNYSYQEDGTITSARQFVINAKGSAANYRLFLGGDFPLAIYSAEKPVNGRCLMIVKDSYSNALVPWLTPYFDKIVLVDPRHYRGNIYHLARQEKITDFMVVNYIIVSELEGYIALLHRLGSAMP
ncbi:hypothetical protein EII17_01050 [Clostridiales bacterium COT073_COT-073]|nr:hypothetical protein EII17_01050 [Clostridiales bacterium COT073_COT-073]